MTLDDILKAFIEAPRSDWSETLGTPTFLFGPSDAPDQGHALITRSRFARLSNARGRSQRLSASLGARALGAQVQR